MVAAAKLRRAQQAVEAARPYAASMRRTLQEVVDGETGSLNPLLEARERVRNVGVIVIASDRGLAGAFNNQVLKQAERLVAEREAAGQQPSLTLVGRRAGDFFRRRRPDQVPLLPIAPVADPSQDTAPGPYSIEPNARRLLATLAPKAVEVEIFQALLESQAGEHAARMTAMESATKNTEELIDQLTLDFNRARQAAITRELVEIVTGAQALD